MTQQAQDEQADTGAVEVGARLRAARAKAGMTRKQLALLSGASERYLALLEAGAGNPSLSVLSAIAATLDLAVPDLLPSGGERSEQQARVIAQVRRLPEDRLEALVDWLGRPSAGNEAKGRRVVLLGLRGAGKSSLGQALAQRLDMKFFEVSKEVQRAYGGSLALLIEMGGQAALRRYEEDAWNAICAQYEDAVISAPGGVVADAPLYERVLNSAHSIWLRADPDDHMKRVMEQGDFRPMAHNRGAMADLTAILEARSQDYGRADRQIDTSRQPFAQTLDMLEKQARALVGP